MDCKDFLEIISEELSKIEPDSKIDIYEQYNIFDVLGVGSKEVIICRFIADLLNPKGKHGCGILFLKCFMEMLGDDFQKYSDNLLENTNVETEYPIDNDRRIDILIHNNEFYLPIEVKIYAEEQKNQCLDYYRYISGNFNGNKLVYLTRYGSAPSDYSTGSNDILSGNIICISFASDIRKMLEKSLPEIKNTFVTSIINSFIETITKHSDPLWKEKDMKFKELYENKEYMLAAIEIEKHIDALNNKKIEKMKNFLKELETKTTLTCKNYFKLDINGREEKQENEHHYYKTCADKYYNGKNTYPGFAYSIKKFPYEGVTLDIRFRVEIEDNLFAGICIYDTTNKREFIPKDNSISFELGKYVKNVTIGDSYWISWVYLPIDSRNLNSNYSENLKGSDIVPNFKYMNEAAIKLFDDNEINCFVQKCNEAIKKFLDNTIIDNNHNS